MDGRYDFYLDGCKLSLVEDAKFLGVTIDDIVELTNKGMNLVDGSRV